MTGGLTARGIGMASGATGATLAGDGGAGVDVGIATLIARGGGEEGGTIGTVVAGLAGGTAGGDTDANVDALTSHGDRASGPGGDDIRGSGRGDGGNVVGDGAGGVNERAMAAKSSGRLSSFGGSGSGSGGSGGCRDGGGGGGGGGAGVGDGGDGSGPAGACAATCMIETGSLVGAGTAGGAIGA